jgi:hypothetical protein
MSMIFSRFIAYLCLIVFPILSEEKAYPILKKQMDQIVYEDSYRKNGFADSEIDHLHYEISVILKALKQQYDFKSHEITATYVSYTPEAPEQFLQKDEEGKFYVKLRIFHGFNPSRPANEELYSYLYLKDESSELEKVIITQRTTNDRIPPYLREVRRIINSTPKSSKALATASDQVDSNADIKIEYYRGELLPHSILHSPISKKKPDLSFELHNPSDPMDFMNQMKLMKLYKENLIYSKVALEILLKKVISGRNALIRKVVQ